jgi:succinate dehydrogenase / fumarate reductase iron-sulfur subunit
MRETYILKVYRGTPGRQHWEGFELPRRDSDNVISALDEIRLHPFNKQGKAVAPIAYESGCLEEVCGSCSMLINGRPRQACTALIGKLVGITEENTITLAPFTKFPLVRDLIVDRSKMFADLKKVQAWVEVDQTIDRGPGPKVFPDIQEIRYSLSTCMTCGCCLEACPQINPRSNFIGPAAISQTRLFNLHPVAKEKKPERNHVMMSPGGIEGCGNAQNCERVCPKEIPLLDAISQIGRDVTVQSFSDIFGFGQKETQEKE